MGKPRFFVLILILSLLLPACGRENPPPPAAEVLTALLAAMEDTAQTLPQGVTRLSAAASDSPDCLTDTLFSALYGEAARSLLAAPPTGEPGVADAALFLSLAPYPCELGVFRCTETDAAQAVAALCHARLDLFARGFTGSEWEHLAGSGQVSVIGNYVVMVLCEDPAPILAAARHALR